MCVCVCVCVCVSAGGPWEGHRGVEGQQSPVRLRHRGDVAVHQRVQPWVSHSIYSTTVSTTVSTVLQYNSTTVKPLSTFLIHVASRWFQRFASRRIYAGTDPGVRRYPAGASQKAFNMKNIRTDIYDCFIIILFSLKLFLLWKSSLISNHFTVNLKVVFVFYFILN